MASFDDIPTGVLNLILSKGTPDSIAVCLDVCKEWRNEILQYNSKIYSIFNAIKNEWYKDRYIKDAWLRDHSDDCECGCFDPQITDKLLCQATKQYFVLKCSGNI